MDDHTRDLAELILRARRGCPEAARLLYDQYSQAVLRAVRRRLNNSPLRRQFDSVDFTQAVWQSFFTSDNQWDIPNHNALIAFLARVAENKVLEMIRAQSAQRRDVQREVPLDAWVAGQGDDLPQFQSPDPTPSQHAQSDEFWERLIARVSPEKRLALELLRAGHTQDEAAKRLGCDRKTIQRLLKGLRPTQD